MVPHPFCTTFNPWAGCDGTDPGRARYQGSRPEPEARSPFPVVWPSEADCTLALEDFRTHHLSHNLGLIDSLIGVTALGLDATLCTFNDKHYRVIPGLQISRPYPR